MELSISSQQRNKLLINLHLLLICDFKIRMAIFTT